jgi:hypothetical protein
MSDPFMRHAWGTRFGSITPNTLWLHYLFFSPPVDGDPDDSPAISSLLLPTCKVHEGDSSLHRIGPLPLGFVPPLLQFYSILYLDKKSSKLFWMTEDEIYSVSLVRFTATLGLHGSHPLPQEATWWSCDGTQSDVLHVWEWWVQIIQSWRIQTIFCSIDFCKRLCLQEMVIHLGSLSMNVFDFIFQEIWNVVVSNNRSCAYAPYIMKMIEKVNVIPRSEKEGTKPPYVCPGSSNHTHGNNMINRYNVINKRVIFLI